MIDNIGTLPGIDKQSILCDNAPAVGESTM